MRWSCTMFFVGSHQWVSNLDHPGWEKNIHKLHNLVTGGWLFVRTLYRQRSEFYWKAYTTTVLAKDKGRRKLTYILKLAARIFQLFWDSIWEISLNVLTALLHLAPPVFNPEQPLLSRSLSPGQHRTKGRKTRKGESRKKYLLIV